MLNKLLLLVITLLISSSAYSATEDEVEMELQAITKDIYFVQGEAGAATENKGFISNAVFIITREGVVLFDSLGTPALAKQMLKLIRTKTDKPIKTVIMSHYHADHLYGLQVFKNLGAEVIAPKGAMEYFEAQSSQELLEARRNLLYPYVDEDTHLVPPDRLVDKNDQFELGGKTFELNAVGAAHSDGDMTVLIKPDNVFLAGDLIFTGRVPYVGRSGTAHWVELLKSIDTKNLAALIPGHGSPAENPADTINLTLNYVSLLREKFSAAIDDLQEFDEAYKAIDWSEYKDLPAFDAANRGNAYRVFLSLEAELLQ